MVLTDEDIQALGLLIGEKVRAEIEPFKEEVREFRHETLRNFDGISKQVETLSQEYLSIREHVKRGEEESCDHEERIAVLEKQCA